MSASDGITPAVEAVATEQAYHDGGVDGVDALQVQQRYGEERAKRLRSDGLEQYVDIHLDPKFAHFRTDPWADPAQVKDIHAMFPENRCRVLIVGAGFGGLLYAVRMVEAGVSPKDIRIIDTAGGWGGTWYWNRYPGIMCDIESYCYLPRLEETGYIPKHRYSYGEEIRNYANLMAEKWGVDQSAVFQTRAQSLNWDEDAKEWQAKLVQECNGGQAQELQIRSTFVALVNGVLNWAKLPLIPGILDYQGTTFHSQRWDYGFTGGSPSDNSLTKLQDKNVAIIGTGCSAIQAVPHLAKWAKHLYVVQRTPSSVDRRDQRETDFESFPKEIATSPGWQRERLRNFNQHFTLEEQPAVNLVNDEWTRAIGMVPVAGYKLGPKTQEEIPEYLKTLHAMDLPRQARIRARALIEVHDPETAKMLQPWYPTWCKRPAFHDDYLASFNRDNVTLLDTAGKDPEKITRDAIVVNGQSYEVDALIFATGFHAPGTGSPAEKANITLIGRGGISMSEEWARNGPSTLHGVLDHNFPNLFLSGPWQGASSANYLLVEDALAKHVAYIITEVERRAAGKLVMVCSTEAAVQDWGMQIMMRGAPRAAMIGCTPGYYNNEGTVDQAPPEAQMTLARSGIWGHGIEDFIEHLEAWQSNGQMQGVEVQV